MTVIRLKPLMFRALFPAGKLDELRDNQKGGSVGMGIE